jgi:hypothetical protein
MTPRINKTSEPDRANTTDPARAALVEPGMCRFDAHQQTALEMGHQARHERDAATLPVESDGLAPVVAVSH